MRKLVCVFPFWTLVQQRMHNPLSLHPPTSQSRSMFWLPVPSSQPRDSSLCSNDIVGCSQSKALNALSILKILTQGLCTCHSLFQACMCPAPFFHSRFNQISLPQEIYSWPPCPRRGALSAHKSYTFLCSFFFTALSTAWKDTLCIYWWVICHPWHGSALRAFHWAPHCACLWTESL